MTSSPPPDTLFVAAAGNGERTPTSPPRRTRAPATRQRPICVGTSDESGDLAPFSTSCCARGRPRRAGREDRHAHARRLLRRPLGHELRRPDHHHIAALAFSAAPTATVADVRTAILSSVDPVAALAGRTATGGKLNAYAALHALTGRDDEPESRPANPEPPGGTHRSGHPQPGDGQAQGRRQGEAPGQQGPRRHAAARAPRAARASWSPPARRPRNASASPQAPGRRSRSPPS